MFVNQSLNVTLKESFESYLITGAGSNEKLKILHGFIKKTLLDALNDPAWTIYSLDRENGKETSIGSLFFDHRPDFAIYYQNTLKAIIELKYAMSSFQKNWENYLMNLIGQTANSHINDVKVFQIFILPEKTFNLKQDGTIKTIEALKVQIINKFIKYFEARVDYSPDFSLLQTYLPILNENDSFTQHTTFNAFKQFYFTHQNNFSITQTFPIQHYSKTSVNDFAFFLQKIVTLLVTK